MWVLVSTGDDERDVERIVKVIRQMPGVKGLSIASDAPTVNVGVSPTRVSRERILEAVVACSGIPLEEILGPGRLKTVAMARHVSMWLFRDLLKLSYPEIGKGFRRDHTTVMSALKGLFGDQDAATLEKQVRDALGI